MPGTETTAEKTGRLLLGTALAVAGTTHLTVARKEFKAQVPDFVTDFTPFSKDDVVLMSGIAELALGAALLVLPKEKERLGWIAAGFFTAIFPGNISQYIERRSAFGLNTDQKRFLRLFGQVPLIAGALWATGAWRRR